MDEPVTAAIGQLSLGKALTEPAVAIIRQHHVTRQFLASERPRLRGIGFQRYLLLHREPLRRPEDRGRLSRVLRRHVVWDSATRLGTAQRQHLRSECCDHNRRQFAWWRGLVDAVEIGAHRRQRFLVAMAAYTFDHRNVTDAETENEPAAVERVQRDHGALGGEGIASIDVGDRTAYRQLLAAR